MDGWINVLKVIDLGDGPALYAAGSLDTACGVPANCLARWDGSSWTALGTCPILDVVALAAYDDGSGPALYVAGSFWTTTGGPATGLARWDGRRSPISTTSSGRSRSSTTATVPCRDPAPLVVCVPPSGSSFPRGTTLVTCTATDASGNQSTCQFPVKVGLKVRRR